MQVVILSGAGDNALAKAALGEGGAVSYLIKDAHHDALTRAIHEAAAGGPASRPRRRTVRLAEPHGPQRRYASACLREDAHVRRLRLVVLAGARLERDGLTLVEGLEALALDLGEVNEQVVAALCSMKP